MTAHFPHKIRFVLVDRAIHGMDTIVTAQTSGRVPRTWVLVSNAAGHDSVICPNGTILDANTPTIELVPQAAAFVAWVRGKGVL